MKGINDTYSMQKTIGDRIKKAREAIPLSRQALCDRLNSNALRPNEEKASNGILPDRLKQWEYGNNPVSIEWLPSLCDELGVDYGYLFGEYNEHTRVTADIAQGTGLSEKAIEKLVVLRNYNSRDWCMDIFNSVIESESFLSLLTSITEYVTESVDLNVIGHGSAVRSTKLNSRDVSALKIQRLIFMILDSLINQFESRIDTRWCYQLLFGMNAENKISDDQLNKAIEKLESGDLSDFRMEGDRNV